MSVIQKNFYSNSDVSIIDLMNTTDSTFKGHHVVSLTNYDNTSLPAIAIGSVVENNGSLFEFTTETAISGSPSDGTVYIYLVPSGDPALGTAVITPTFTNTLPTWSDSKQGWYGTVGSANYRYLEFKMTKATASYSNKTKFFYDDNITLDIANITTANINTLVMTNPIRPNDMYNGNISSPSISENDIYDTIFPFIISNGSTIKVNGIYRPSGGGDWIMLTHLSRNDTSSALSGSNINLTSGTITTGNLFVNGSATTYRMNISW